MQIAVCDDDRCIRENLAEMAFYTMRDKGPDIDLYASGEELLLSQKDYDIVVLEIEMKGINGIDTAKAIRKKSDSAIIFVTEFKDYAFEAFDVDAANYLLKPVDNEKFKSVLNRVYSGIEKKKSTGNESFVVKTLEGFETISPPDILFAENAGRKIILHTKKEIISYYDKMENLEKRLGAEFFRCHRGYLVSFSKIKRYDSREIELVNGEKILVSKQKYPLFVQSYMNYVNSLQ